MLNRQVTSYVFVGQAESIKFEQFNAVLLKINRHRCYRFFANTLEKLIEHIFNIILFGLCREILEAYSAEMKKLAMTLLSQLAKALKMDDAEMKELLKEGAQSMRMNYYPPCPEPDLAIGFSPHSDADALTILFQLKETEGLQIRKDGKWVSVKPLHNSFVVNVGDILEVHICLLSF